MMLKSKETLNCCIESICKYFLFNETLLLAEFITVPYNKPSSHLQYKWFVTVLNLPSKVTDLFPSKNEDYDSI